MTLKKIVSVLMVVLLAVSVMAGCEGRSFVVYGDRGAAVYEGGVLKLRYINPEQVVPEIISDPGTPGASFGASGTYESEFKIDWITEEKEVNVEGEGCLMQYWKHMYESYRNNAPFFHYGPVLHKYTGSGGKGGSNDATAEYVAELRNIFEIKFL